MKQKLKITNIISINVLKLIQIQIPDLSEYLLIDYPSLKDFQLFILQFIKKKVMKLHILVIFFSLVRKRTNRKKLDRNFKI